MRARCLLFSFLFFAWGNAQAQITPEQLRFSGYLETYYAFDFGQPASNERPALFFNYKRHNEVSLNLGLLQAEYAAEKVRSKLGIMVGDYARYNLEGQPAWAQFVYEASVGVRLLEDLWMDMGVMPSHLGFESALGKSCWHLSRSLLAESSPYYLTGARVTYAPSEDLEMVFWLTNGWQTVQRINNHRGVGLGAGIRYRPAEKLELSYSNYLGNEYPAPLSIYRFFNNAYLRYEWNSWGIIGGLDYGMEERLFSRSLNRWMGMTASLRKQLTEPLAVAVRAEHYSDPNGVILPEGMKVAGASINMDYAVTENSLIRLEYRYNRSPDPVFDHRRGKFAKENTVITTSIAIEF